MKLNFALFLVCALSLPAAALAQTTTAQQLGYGPNDKVLMVHADDIGMSHSVNVASIEAFKKGMVTSGSIMVPCPWFPEIADYARQHPELDLGLHLTLTSEWKYLRWRPVASPDKVKGLLDPDGFMWRSERDTAKNASPQEIETEIRAQIERALQFGIKPTHLDTHMGTLYTRQDFFDVYTKLGKEYGIPVMVMRPTPEAIQYAKLSGIPIGEDALKKIADDGFAMLDYLNTGVPGKTPAERKEAYKKFLRSMKPGVTMLIVHLGMNDPELKATTGSWEQRYGDFLAFTDPEIEALIKELGIKLTTWREMGKVAWPGQTRQSPGVTRYPFKGKIIETHPQYRDVVIEHEAIPNYMEAMTMHFALKDESLYTKLKPGDFVQATLAVEQRGGKWWLEDVTIKPKP
ncbi:MAG: ChbG/HpnK family deacetylase [Acidobacteria bacterium]|nr:ChbG/HpnK family deacetylase [Acidobacteriota bacterium]